MQALREIQQIEKHLRFFEYLEQSEKCQQPLLFEDACAIIASVAVKDDNSN